MHPLFRAFVLFASGLGLGIFLGIVWVQDPTGILVNSLLFLLSGLVIGAGTAVLARRRREIPVTTREEEHAERAVRPPVVAETQPRPTPHLARPVTLGKHVAFERRENRFVVQISDWWKYEKIEFAFAYPRFPSRRDFLHWVTQTETLAGILFVGALGVYAITRFTLLDQFPIYFFADEAIQPVLAEELIQSGGRDYLGHWFPMFFNTYGFFNPLFTVYPQAIGILLFGKSLITTRAVSAFITLIGSAAAGLTLKEVFRIRYWWAGVLFVALTPAFFLHSRTAFETATMVSFYASFLFCYLLYRTRSPRFIYPTLVFAAMTFYTYGNGQLIIGLSGLLFLVADLRHHLQNWRTNFRAGVLLVLLTFPYLQFQAERPNEAASHLRTLDTYLFRQIPLETKVQTFLNSYGYALSPQYWVIPNTHDLPRHLMKNYGNLSLWTLPLFLIGAALAIWRIKKPEYRDLILATLATPIGGVLTEVSITRVLAFIFPAALFTALGLDLLLTRLRSGIWQVVTSFVVFIILSIASLGMLNDALVYGAGWYGDYGLYGMQWGAKQLFGIIPNYLGQSNLSRVYLTPTWANGTDVFLRFFIPREPRVQINNVTSFLDEKRALDASAIFIMTPEERNKAIASGKFKPIEIDRVLNYPDGSVGFYFARLEYVDAVDAIFAREKAERQKPVTETLVLNGETITVIHSRLDAGQIKDLFDRDTFTLVRGQEANPIFFEFIFPTPRPISGLGADFGTLDFELAAALFASDSDSPATYTQTYRKLGSDPHIDLKFDNAPPLVKKMRIVVRDLNQGDTAKIHVREFTFK